MTRRLHKTLAVLAALGMLQAAVGKAAPPQEQSPRRQSRPAENVDAAGNKQNPARSAKPRQYLKSPAGSAATTRQMETTPRSRNAQLPGSRTYGNRASNVQRTSWQEPPAREVAYQDGPVADGGSGGEYISADGYDPGMSQGYSDVYSPGEAFGPAGSFDSGYGGDCGDGCGPCGPCRGPIYVRGEYLAWWATGDSLPPLVTTSPASTLPAQAGVLGQPGTSILYGNDSVNKQARSGARVAIGWWISPMARIEGDWFGLGTIKSNFDQSSDGGTILARPFFNLSTHAPDSNLIAYPGLTRGTIGVQSTSNFLGAGIHATQNMMCCDNSCNRMGRVDFLYGVRYLGLYEGLTDNGTLTTLTQGTVPTGTVLSTTDSFKTSNSFFGGNLGLSGEMRKSCWTLSGVGRLGIGGTSETVTISGSTATTLPGNATTRSNGGLLAMPTNIGTYHRNVFALVPHLELKVGYNFTPAWRATFGYDVIYWSRVVRPGQQVDLFVNPSQASGQPLVGTPGPLFRFVESDLWVQGISGGLEYKF